MRSQIRPIFTMFVLLMLITGVFYPLLVTGLSQMIFPFQANGSLIKVNGQVLGSQLIGQDFSGAEYFWSRPSATLTNPYNAYDQKTLTGSSGSNLGPLSQILVNNVQARVNYLMKSNPANPLLVPIDLVTASASGLDPEISVQAAYYQIARVAQARGLSVTDVTTLVEQSIENPQFGLLGVPRVNVLMLNLALEGIK